MCFSKIPYFKEIIIMAFVCDHCGYRNSEIKEGGGIADKAKRITLTVDTPQDLNRDLYKSDSAKFSIPELDFDMGAGTLGSVFTTVEGLLDKLVTKLDEKNPFQGDSSQNKVYQVTVDRLRELKDGGKPFTLVLDDAADNCFVYNPNAPNEDPKIKIEIYERTAEQNEELGLDGMNVDNY